MPLALMGAFSLGAAGATSVFLWSGIQIRPKLFADRLPATVVSKNADAAALARFYLSDRLVADAGLTTNRMAKTSYEPALLAKADAEPAPDRAQTDMQNAAAADREPLLPAENFGDGASLTGAEQTVDGTVGKPVKPSLYFDRQSKQNMIGSFQTRTFPGDRESCAELGKSMVRTGDDASGTLQTLADTGAITVLRVCAANGSVVISCRAGQVTVSPRPSRPDDKCEDYRSRRLATN